MKWVISFFPDICLQQTTCTDLRKESVSVASRTHTGQRARWALGCSYYQNQMLTFQALRINFAIESILKQVGTSDVVSSIQRSHFMV